MTKTFQHLKQWQPTSIVSALSLESVRIVNRYEVHKRPKTTVVFETSFLLAKPNGYPTFHGRCFSMGTFLKCVPFIKFNYKDCTERKFDEGNSGKISFQHHMLIAHSLPYSLYSFKTNKGFEEIISFVTFRGLLFRFKQVSE